MKKTQCKAYLYVTLDITASPPVVIGATVGADKLNLSRPSKGRHVLLAFHTVWRTSDEAVAYIRNAVATHPDKAWLRPFLETP